MRKMFIESILAVSSVVLYNLNKGGDDKDKRRKRKTQEYKSMMLLLNRLSGDVNFFFAPDEINKLGKNAIPLTKLTGDLLSLMGELPNIASKEKGTYKSGSYKGFNRFGKKLIDITPGSRLGTDIYKIGSDIELEELR